MASSSVLHVIDSFGVGGAQQRLFHDLGHFNGALRHQACALFDLDSGMGGALERRGIVVHRLGLRGLADLPAGVYRLTQLIRQDPSIRLLHTQLFCADAVGRMAARLCGVPVVSTAQSAIYEPDSGLDSPWRRWLDRRTGSGVARFVAVSGFVKQSLHRRLGIAPEKVTVIPNSVDLGLAAPDPARRQAMRARLRLEPSAFVWATVGRPNPQKGYGFLLEAMTRVLVQQPQTQLLMIGDGPQRPQLSRAAEAMGLSEAVQFLGEQRDVIGWLDAADGFVFPSLSEGLPLALLEAMAMGKPCVASRIAPHEEIITDWGSGLLVAPRDAGPLAGAMLRVQQQPELARSLGEHARARARDFDAASCARRLEALYGELLG
jgi:glycosyltransferase involved in cell wall biosynthesis